MDIFEQFLSEIRKVVREELQSMPQHSEDCWMNTKELCEYLGVSRSWVSHRLDKLPHTKEPLRFRRSDIDKWLEMQMQNEIEEKNVDANVEASGKKKKYRVV